MAKAKIPFVIAYDFDGTLSPGNMQEYDFIPQLKMTSDKFWSEVKELAKAQNSDEILAYMQIMLHQASSEKQQVTRDVFNEFGSNIAFFDGVQDWFKRMNQYGKERGVQIQHSIISSGLREMIEGTSIATYFDKIYASGFMYDQHGVAYWPALAVNYTTKTQYLFRINKGCLDEDDNSEINQYIEDSQRAVPFENMVFIGDGQTDIPCMRLVKNKGGLAIAVYPKGKKNAKSKAEQLVVEGRANLAIHADYREGSNAEQALYAMIDKACAQNALKKLSPKKKLEKKHAS